jgi:inorganic phosphate transporter, PiT family
MSAESASAAIILLSAHFGYALSTTQVVTGSVLGSGVGKPGAEVRWGVAGRMVTAWLITLPSAGLVGAITYLVVHGLGGFLGAIVGFTLLSATAFAIWLQSRKVRVDHRNVNHEWEGNLTAGLDSTDEPSLEVNGGVPGANGQDSTPDAAAAQPGGAPSKTAPAQKVGMP